MRMKGNVKLIGILVLAMVVLASVQVVGADTAQTWYFTNIEASAPIYTGADYNKIMTKGAEGEDVTITLAPGERVWFYANQLAECDVGFPSEKGNEDYAWDVSYWIKTQSEYVGTKRLYTRLHNITSDEGHKRIKEGHNDISYSTDFQENSESLIPDEPFTVQEGGRFAIEILWQSGDQGNLEIHCNPLGKHASNVTSPASDPGYPVPELSTLLLISIGLITLTGYVLLAKKRRK